MALGHRHAGSGKRGESGGVKQGWVGESGGVKQGAEWSC